MFPCSDSETTFNRLCSVFGERTRGWKRGHTATGHRLHHPNAQTDNQFTLKRNARVEKGSSQTDKKKRVENKVDKLLPNAQTDNQFTLKQA